MKQTCLACTHSYMEPDGEAVLICGHKDAGLLGLYIRRMPLSHCPDFSKFEQHPDRNPDGSLKEKAKVELYDADPNCEHEIETLWSGVKCRKCPGWFCY